MSYGLYLNNNNGSVIFDENINPVPIVNSPIYVQDVVRVENDPKFGTVYKWTASNDIYLSMYKLVMLRPRMYNQTVFVAAFPSAVATDSLGRTNGNFSISVSVIASAVPRLLYPTDGAGADMLVLDTEGVSLTTTGYGLAVYNANGQVCYTSQDALCVILFKASINFDTLPMDGYGNVYTVSLPPSSFPRYVVIDGLNVSYNDIIKGTVYGPYFVMLDNNTFKFWNTNCGAQTIMIVEIRA